MDYMRLGEPGKRSSRQIAEGDQEASKSNHDSEKFHFWKSGQRWKFLSRTELDGMRSENNRGNDYIFMRPYYVHNERMDGHHFALSKGSERL